MSLKFPALNSTITVQSLSGWIIFQQKFLSSLTFELNNNWNAYRQGFGDYLSGYWMGLNKIHLLTAGSICRMRVEVQDSVTSMWFSMEYTSFVVDDESNAFAIHLSDFSGDNFDSFNTVCKSGFIVNGMKFSTSDVDNDGWNGNSCASSYLGGWWYNFCGGINLNGQGGCAGFGQYGPDGVAKTGNTFMTSRMMIMCS